MNQKKYSRREVAALTAGISGMAVLAGTPAQANQPNMQKALDHLHAARSALMDANDNKGGHRKKAVAYVDAAIEETKAGMKAAAS